MPLDLTDLEAWVVQAQSELAAANARVLAEEARDIGRDQHEMRLHGWYVGHLRSRAIELQAKVRWLQAGAAAVLAGGTHPAQYGTAPVLDTEKSVPPKPPAWASG